MYTHLRVVAFATIIFFMTTQVALAAGPITTTLYKGMRGTEVRTLQEYLHATGAIPSDAVTGYFGSVTEQAVKALQARHALEQTGTVGPRTRMLIASAEAPQVLGVSAGGERVLIRFERVADAEAVRAVGGVVTRVFHLVPVVAATLPQSAIDTLMEHNRNVVSVEEDAIVTMTDHTTTVSDTELSNAWGVKHIGAGAVHALGNKGTGVKVAILDTGLNYNHPDLNANYVMGYDFVNNDADPMDDNGHGTHVAGTIAAEDDGVGVVGVAPEAKLYIAKILDANGGGTYSNVVAGLEWAVDNGAQVTNASIGGGSYNSALEAAYNAAAAAGVINVASAGNSGTCDGTGDNVAYPARFASVIAVAGTNGSNARECWSSTGPKIELAAPGGYVYSTYGSGYGTMSGTSMASPHVAGVAALAVAAGHTNVRAQLAGTAIDLGVAGRDSLYGYGLVDADGAAGPAVPVPNTPPQVSITSPAANAIIGSGTSVNFVGSASDTEDGSLSFKILWASSLDGALGSGESFSKVLTDGVHTITASVTDSSGTTTQTSRTVSVRPLATMSMVLTSNKSLYTNKDTAVITATVTSGTLPVPGATVQISVRTAAGNTVNKSATTDAAGVAKFSLKITKGFYGVGVSTVTATASRDGYNQTGATLTFQTK